MKTKKIAVVMGGPSSEREVSLRTGQAILQALRSKGYQAVGLELDPAQFIDDIRQAEVDVVFNAVHGKFGEDGMLQGTLEMLGIPYTGSGVLASAVAMDKSISKRLFLSSGIPTPRSQVFNKYSDGEEVAAAILAGFTIPVVVKSSAQGSSIGVTIVDQAEKLAAALKEAFAYSDNLVVEEFIDGREVTIAVWGNKSPAALPIIEIVPHSGCYDYHSKYTTGATDYIVPAPLEELVVEKLQKVAVQAFNLLGCRGIARVDVMLDKANQPYVLEVNTIPGMTATSLVPKAAAASGISFADLCERLLLMAGE